MVGAGGGEVDHRSGELRQGSEAASVRRGTLMSRRGPRISTQMAAKQILEAIRLAKRDATFYGPITHADIRALTGLTEEQENRGCRELRRRVLESKKLSWVSGQHGVGITGDV